VVTEFSTSGAVNKLDSLINEIQALQSKLILVIAPPRFGKTQVLREVAARRAAKVLNVGIELGSRLAALPAKERKMKALEILRGLADEYASGDLLLLDNLELLFDKKLKLDPLALLKRHAHSRRVVAVWPGEIHNGRLIYAELVHPEYQDYGLDGLVPLDLEKIG